MCFWNFWQENKKNGTAAEKQLSHFGPSSATRTRGLMLPNNRTNFFLIICRRFNWFFVGFTSSLKLLPPLFPAVPELVMVKYVVKNRFPKIREAVLSV